MISKKQLLIITNYYPPEKGAASNRMYAMVKAFAENGYDVTVVCPLPNYPTGKVFKGFRNKFIKKTKEAHATVYRLWIFPSNSNNKFLRLLAMLSFSKMLGLFFIYKKLPKKVLIQYSPVFVGFTAVFWSWVLRKKIILNVSDLWPLAGLEMGILKKGFYYTILCKMEAFCYARSHLILGQSKEIVTYIKNKGVTKPLFLYRNFPKFYIPRTQEAKPRLPIKIVYAGLLGVAQGMFTICSNIKLPKEVELHIYGAGPEAKKIEALNNDGIFYHGEIDRQQLHEVLQNYHLGLVPLINRIYGSVPSKIFELALLGLPIIYYAGGEGEEIIKKYDLGWVIPTGNFVALQQFITSLSVEKLNEKQKSIIQERAKETFSFDKQFLSLLTLVKKI